jgi:hypothetical protein
MSQNKADRRKSTNPVRDFFRVFSVKAEETSQVNSDSEQTPAPSLKQRPEPTASPFKPRQSAGIPATYTQRPPALTPDTVTVRPRGAVPRSKSASASGSRKVIKASSEPTSSPRDDHAPIVSITNGNVTTTTSSIKPGHGTTSTAQSTSNQLAGVTSTSTTTTTTQTNTRTLGRPSTPSAVATSHTTPSKAEQTNGAMHVKSASSPARMEKAPLASVLWLENVRNDSSRHLEERAKKAWNVMGIAPPSSSSVDKGNSSSSTRIRSPLKLRPRKLSQQRRSTNLNQENHIVKQPDPPLAYPKNASDCIGKEYFSNLRREAQMMIVGLIAVVELYALVRQEFGSECTWEDGMDDPLREWAQRGITHREDIHECEYFHGRKKFERFYVRGSSVDHFKQIIQHIKGIPAGEPRAAAIRKLLKQGDHNVNLALETLRGITLRKEYSFEKLDAVWSAMVADEVDQSDLDFIKAYFGENCIAVQAFINAFVSVAAAAGDMQTKLQTFYFYAPHFLGQPYTDFQLGKAALATQLRKNVMANSKVTDKLTDLLNEFSHKPKLALELGKTMGELADSEESGMRKVFHEIYTKSAALLRKLGEGDQRFARAAGLDSITEPLPEPELIEPVMASPLSAQLLSRQLREPTATVLPSLPPSPEHGNQ